MAILAIWKPWDVIWTVVLSSAICIIAFFLTASVVTTAINKQRLENVNQKIPPIENRILTSTGNEYEKATRKLLRYYTIKSRIR